MKIIYITVLVLFGIKTYAQEFYITTYDYATYLNTIKYVDPDLNVTPLTSLYFSGDQIWDIAFAPDGKLYGALSDALIEIDVAQGTYTVVYEFPVSGQYNSLVCNSNNQIITLEYNSRNLITIDLATFTEVSNVVLTESSPGDLTFYKGNLIFQGATSNNILSFDGNNLKTVACAIRRMSGENFLFFGLSNYTDSCENSFVYGFSEDGYVYRYNIESKTNEEVGILDYFSGPINGSTSINEYSASACPFLDLDEVNCNLKITEEQLTNILLYPNPVEDILHIQDLNIPEEMFFTIYSLEGRKLTEDILTPQIDFTQFAQGIYFIEIYNKSKTLSTTKKILKK